MDTQGIFNMIMAAIMLSLCVADSIFLASSAISGERSILIGALCGILLVITIYGLYAINNL